MKVPTGPFNIKRNKMDLVHKCKDAYNEGFDRRLKMMYLLADYQQGNSRKGDELKLMLDKEKVIRQKFN